MISRQEISFFVIVSIFFLFCFYSSPCFITFNIYILTANRCQLNGLSQYVLRFIHHFILLFFLYSSVYFIGTLKFMSQFDRDKNRDGNQGNSYKFFLSDQINPWLKMDWKIFKILICLIKALHFVIVKVVYQS